MEWIIEIKCNFCNDIVKVEWVGGVSPMGNQLYRCPKCKNVICLLKEELDVNGNN
jgi:hypothetical protein